MAENKNEDYIELYEITNQEDGYKDRDRRTPWVVKTRWKILKKYRDFVLLEDKHGIRECFSYWYIQKHMNPPIRTKSANGKTTLSFN